MRTKKLGWTDLNLTVVGLGTFAQGGGSWTFNWGPQDDNDSIATIRRALELGINWIDTAAVYGLGHAEKILGRAIKGLVEKPIIATKCCRVWNQKGDISKRFTKESVRAEAEASLKRLGLNTIDLYQVHWPGSDAENEEAWSAIARMVQEGKIRYAGVSNFSAKQIKRIQPIHPVASLQPPYSIIHRDIEKGLLNFCAENRIGVVAYSPMQKGMLSDKFTREFVQNLAPEDHRRRDPDFLEPRLSNNLKLTAGLRLIAEKYGMSTAQFALAWVLRRTEVTSAIVGARRPGQIEETYAAGDRTLTDEAVAAVEILLR
ncbi:MAG: aldo/keto reductase [Candidatus Omnitrophota bacterium]